MVRQGGDVVPIDRAGVLDAEIGEHRLRGEHVLDPGLESVQQVVGGPADQGQPGDGALDQAERLLVAMVRAQAGEVIGKAADGWRVRAAVVVDDDHKAQVVVVGDVVQGLPGHAAGQGAVSNDGHNSAVLATQPDALCEPLGPREGGGGMRIGHPVVLRLSGLWVAGEAALLPEAVEAACPSGDDFVHVALVARVEDDRVRRRVEHLVDCERQLDDAEIGAEMAARARDLCDQEGTDLVRELLQLPTRERAKIARAADRLQQRHDGHSMSDHPDAREVRRPAAASRADLQVGDGPRAHPVRASG